MHTCCELESVPRSKHTYASPPHRAQSFASNRKLAYMAGCCGSRDGEQPPTSAHQGRGPLHGVELRQAAGAFGAAVEVTSSDARTEATYRHRDIACASWISFIIAVRYGDEQIFIQRDLIDHNFVSAYRSSVVGLLPGGIP